MQAHLSELRSKLHSLDLSSHSNDVNIRKLNAIVDKLTKRGRNDDDRASDVENRDGDTRMGQESADDDELISWARTARQIMMDISEIDVLFASIQHCFLATIL